MFLCMKQFFFNLNNKQQNNISYMHIYIYRQIDRQVDRQIDGQIDRQIDIDIDIDIYKLRRQKMSQNWGLFKSFIEEK